jgi:hypothetical protein
MDMTIDLSEHDAALLEAQARAAHMSAERYLAAIVARALERRQRRAADDLAAHLDVMASQASDNTTPEEMEAALEEALTHVRTQRVWKP